MASSHTKHRQGNQTRVAYCQDHDLALSSFDYWAGRIRKGNQGKDETMVRVGVVERPETVAKTENHHLILHIEDRYRLVVPSPVNQEDVRRLIEVLENR